jgi:hypothetical protein
MKVQRAYPTLKENQKQDREVEVDNGIEVVCVSGNIAGFILHQQLA